ncbi:HAMP domain-containing histidine kinase [Panacibacter ginsenosidivorans]|uniref:histidine kinase n=1 Tax=Panacibacter ginsenosidivorans TaxID=1813871 RepID=A0A5B8V630_9BACT|nr:HAMP domain-containing sensor histidine kinase [Panacibacter ginsenosidivorans]QEC66880.1 HAMP domain-containing histidine kinase [Panacibacter ginsenosidivorans]
MKKIFPIIVVLIALSIVGLIVIQVQWVSNLLVVQGERFLYKVDKAGVSVSEQIGQQTLAGRVMRLPHRRDLNFMPNDLSFGITRMPTIAERYSEQDIDSALRREFDKEELKNFRFEFAITSNATDFRAVELQSTNFFKELMDTVHNRREEIAIVPESGSDMEGLMAYEHLILIVPDFKTQVWHSITWVIVGAALFNIIIIAAFYLAVKTILNQRKLNAIKSDFINNMTHELKTPLATISLATDAMKNEKVLADRSKLEYFSSIIKDENKRMSKHVETILQAGLMDRQDIRMNIKPVHVHMLLQKVLDTFNLQFQEKGAATTLLLNAKDDLINADEAHFTNLISNLIDNAIKYSKEKDPLQLKITTHSSAKFFVMQVEDNGIGMSKETTKRIFEKFYRAHTGNIHNVKGFGLGMSYVKTIVDVHKGRVRVDSTLGKGSTFTIEMPLAKA